MVDLVTNVFAELQDICCQILRLLFILLIAGPVPLPGGAARVAAGHLLRRRGPGAGADHGADPGGPRGRRAAAGGGGRRLRQQRFVLSASRVRLRCDEDLGFRSNKVQTQSLFFWFGRRWYREP